jgi:hypothetical protein
VLRGSGRESSGGRQPSWNNGRSGSGGRSGGWSSGRSGTGGGELVRVVAAVVVEERRSYGERAGASDVRVSGRTDSAPARTLRVPTAASAARLPHRSSHRTSRSRP